jgi:membrane protease YdiL (CAAX protease family)
MKLVRVFLFFVLSAAFLAVAAPIAADVHFLPPVLAIGAITSAATFLLTMAFVRWEKISLRDVGAAFSSRSIPRFVVGFLIGSFLVAAYVMTLAFAAHVRFVRSTDAGIGGIAVSLLVYVLLACREELAFRGFPLRRLHIMYGLWIAQVIVAVVFAIEHVAGGSTWMQAFLGPAIGSLLFGMAAIATEGLAVPIGIHAAWNFGDWMQGGKDSTGLWKQTISPEFTARAANAGRVGYIIIFLAAAAGFWWLRRREPTKRLSS